ncbi:hypothetical protein RKD23_007748 [Streptomyces sp. SAI-170]|uniref:hypothetical protein n=1 Tax=Streptomyces sp. SAI-170 TaxID=3377729 RepID=UPI003C7CD170
MVVTHHITDGTLHVQLARELHVTDRAAAALQIEALVHAHFPERVTIALPTHDPSPMTFSALGRVHRMCQSLGIPLTATGPDGQVRPTPLGVASPTTPLRWLEHGARHDH